jgi:hypothetical protein
MNQDDLGEQISRLEARIEELAELIERCRNVILFSKIAMVVGAALLLAILFGAIRSDPAAMVAAIAAVIGGIVLFGSNSSTSERSTAALKAAEAQRADLIGRIELRVVGGEDDRTLSTPT